MDSAAQKLQAKGLRSNKIMHAHMRKCHMRAEFFMALASDMHAILIHILLPIPDQGATLIRFA